MLQFATHINCGLDFLVSFFWMSWSLSNRLNVEHAYESVRTSAIPVTGVWVVVFVDL